MKSIKYKILFFLICYLQVCSSFAQSKKDSVAINLDTLKNIVSDTLIPNAKSSSKIGSIKISKDAIKDELKYEALDSSYTDVVNKEVRLYGNAVIEYEKMKITADYIILNFNTNLVYASWKRDSSVKIKTLPNFTDGDKKGTFKELKYNLKSKQGIVKDISTQESEFFINGETTKMVASDSIHPEGKFYEYNAIISTCNHNPPHFGIRTLKMKMIPKEIAVMGPAQLEIAGIPTPVVLPFGFFPLVKGRSSGLIFPNNYTFDKDLGFGLQGIGYYFPINDYLDAKVTTSIWTRGTYSFDVGGNYRKRYKYSGNFNLNFANNIREDNDGKPISAKSFGIRLSHSQDSKAHPYRNIGGSINIETNRNSQRNNFDYASTINNKLTSNFNYSYRWPESPFSFRAALSHNQDNRTRIVNITLPDASITMNPIQPFKRKNQTGDPKWYENILLDYEAGLKNYVRTTDTTLFTVATLNNLETGFNHNSSLSTNFRMLKYFNVAPNLTYEETYFLKTLQKEFNPDTVFRNDLNRSVLRYGTVKDTLIRDLSAFRKMNSSVSLNTALFATYRRSKGWLRGLRHTIKPNFTFTYSPETQKRYQKFVDTDSRPEENVKQAYNPFNVGVFSQSLNDEQKTLSFNFSNVFEAKYWSKKDSVEKKRNIFNNIYLSGNYNFARDTQQWSDISVSGNADFIQGVSSVQFNLLFTPYDVDWKSQRRLNTLAIKNKTDRKLLNLINVNIGFNTNLTFRQIKDLFKGEKEKINEKPKKPTDQTAFIDVFENIGVNHNLSISITKTPAGKDTSVITSNSIYITGQYPLTKKWSLNIGSIAYDFKAGKLVYPSFGLSRDLHCWTMRFSWFPDNGVYSFFIGVKQGAFNFLKYDYNQPYVPRF